MLAERLCCTCGGSQIVQGATCGQCEGTTCRQCNCNCARMRPTDSAKLRPTRGARCQTVRGGKMAQGCQTARWRNCTRVPDNETVQLNKSAMGVGQLAGQLLLRVWYLEVRGPVRSELGSQHLGPSRTWNWTSSSVRVLCRTLDRTSVQFAKVRVRTMVQDQTAASLGVAYVLIAQEGKKGRSVHCW